MRHRIVGKHLGRNHNERQSLLRSQLNSMFQHGFIKTTDAKVKFLMPELNKYFRVLVNKTEIESQRLLNVIFNDRGLTSRVYNTFKETFADVKTGFTKVEPVKYRQGDNALIVKLSFVKPYTLKVAPAKEKTKKEVKVTAKKAVVKKVAKKEVKK